MEYPHDHHKKKKINPKKPVYFECSRTIRVRMQRAWSDNREKQPRKWSAQISRAINSRRGKYSRQRRKKRGRWSDAYLSQLIHDVENIFHWKKNAEICPWSRWIAKANRGVLFPHSPNRQNDCWETAPRFLPLAPSPSLSRQKSPHKQANPDHLSPVPPPPPDLLLHLSLYIYQVSPVAKQQQEHLCHHNNWAAAAEAIEI